MKEYIIRRLIYSAFTIFAIATILFVMFRMMPGDPTAQVISPALDEVAQRRMREAFGLDVAEAEATPIQTSGDYKAHHETAVKIKAEKAAATKAPATPKPPRPKRGPGTK